MSIFRSAWSSLIYNTTKGGAGVLNSTSLYQRYRKEEKTLVYNKRRGYKSVLAFEASRIAVQTAIREVNQIYPRYLARKQEEGRREILANQKANQAILIENQQIMKEDGFGKLEDGTNAILALDAQGDLVQEAMFLSYTGDSPVDVQQFPKNRSDGARSIFQTNLVYHIDLAPQISLSSQKNLILTQVQGRDYSRKELVGGGDLTFSVDGNIMCHQPGVYPTADVQRFIMNMQYGGILDVHHFQFAQLGVKRIIIKEWSLGRQECKNIQPYSFSCVAVEPDEAIQLKDTIQQLDDISADNTNTQTWRQLLLSELKNTAVNGISSIMEGSIASLSEFTSGII